MVKTSRTELVAISSIVLCYFISGTNCDDMRKDPRIVNGNDATYMRAYLNYHALIVRNNWDADNREYWPYYGGAIIDELHVLTCAHCVSDISVHNLEVVVGNVDIKDRKITRKVENIFIHEQYFKRTLRHNIALVRVKDPFTWSPFVGPFPLRRILIVPFAKCYITGFGKTGKSEDMSPKLLYAQVDLIDQATCERELNTRDEEICAYSLTNGTCGGDAGAILNCHAMLFGVLSYSAKDCKPGYGAYCDVTKYFDWIKDHGGPAPRVGFEDGTSDGTSSASVTAPASPVLNFISLLLIILLGKIVGNL